MSCNGASRNVVLSTQRVLFYTGLLSSTHPSRVWSCRARGRWCKRLLYVLVFACCLRCVEVRQQRQLPSRTPRLTHRLSRRGRTRVLIRCLSARCAARVSSCSSRIAFVIPERSSSLAGHAQRWSERMQACPVSMCASREVDTPTKKFPRRHNKGPQL